METFETKSVKGTFGLGKKLGKRFAAGDCVALTGQLGAGKTALVRGIATGLGLGDERLVSSPTFVLIQEYPASLPVYHVDLYRLSDAETEFVDLGIDEMLLDGVVLIEWAERAAAALPKPYWQITIDILSQKSRRFTLQRISAKAGNGLT